MLIMKLLIISGRLVELAGIGDFHALFLEMVMPCSGEVKVEQCDTGYPVRVT
jgi:hypothetical protein